MSRVKATTNMKTVPSNASAPKGAVRLTFVFIA
jgi:hypothetical protein